MKKILIFFPLLFVINVVQAQNVGIGTTSPKALLHVADSAVLFTGPAVLPTSTNYLPPIQGTGTRMMWYPQKAAFRVGGVELNRWDKDAIGILSFAAGYAPMASGLSSTAMGYYSNATGEISTAFGYNTTAAGARSLATGSSTLASGNTSTAMGAGTIANGIASFATGYNTKATGDYSTAIGAQATASGLSSIAAGAYVTASGGNSFAFGTYATASQDFATAIGRYATASNYSSVAIGEKDTASGAFSVSMGIQTKSLGESSVSFGNNTMAKARGSFVSGLYNDTLDAPDNNTAAINDRIFQLGNGTDGARSNALTILRNGNTGIGVLNPVEKLEVDGKIKTTSLQITNAAANGSVLTSDANGNANWTTPVSTPVYWAASGNNIYNSNTGNVGIGTNSPGFPLNFASTIGDKISLWGNASNGGSIGFGVQPSLLQIHSYQATDDIAFGYGSSNNFTEQMRIKGNGNVGIGTSAPNAPLQFASTLTSRKIVMWQTGNNDHQFSGFGVNGNVVRYQSDNPNADHVFYSAIDASSSKELVRIKGNGNVGIGLNPTYQLHLGNSNKGMRIEGPATSGTGGSSLNIGGSGEIIIDAPNIVGGRFTIKENGNMGIGTYTPAAKLDVNGFTKLGEQSPNIKMKVLTGTTGSTEHYGSALDFVRVQTGITGGNILSVNVFVTDDNNDMIPPGYSYLPGYEYNYKIWNGGTILEIENINLNSAHILSKPFTAFITYKE